MGGSHNLLIERLISPNVHVLVCNGLIDKGGCNLLMETLLSALYSKDVALQVNPGSWQQQLLLQSQGPGPE